MKKFLWICVSLVLISMVAGTSPAECGQWMWTHGNGGHFWTDMTWGSGRGESSKSGLHVYDLYCATPPASFDARPGYAYYAVPTISGGSWTARFLKIIVGGYDVTVPPLPPVGHAFVIQITVNNGNDPVKTFTGEWGGTGYHEISLDLGVSTTFSKGLGVELKLVGPMVTSPESPNTAGITIIGVGAEFIQGVDVTAANSLLLND